jgi:hypothetical protein
MARPYRIDPDVLRERNRKAGIAAQSLDATIRKLEAHERELSIEQRYRLAQLLLRSGDAA